MEDNGIPAEELIDEVAPVDETLEDDTQAQEPEALEEPQEEKSFVTVDDFEQFKAQLDARENEILRRAKQSNADRFKAIQAEVEKIKSRNKAIGIELSPEQERMMRQRVENDMLMQESPQANGQDEAPQGAGTGGVNDPKLLALGYGFEKGGVEVSPGDPEAGLIDTALRNPSITPFEMADIAKEAAEKKAKRLASSKAKSRVKQPTGGGGRGARKGILYDPTKPASHYFEQAGKGSR